MAREYPVEHYAKMTMAQLVYGLTQSGWLAGHYSEMGYEGWTESAIEYVKEITEELERRIKEKNSE